MASERQRPTNLIVSVSTRPQRRAIAPPARIERALTWFAWKPRWGKAATEVCRVLVRSPEVTKNNLSVEKIVHSGVRAVAWWVRR